MQQLELVTGFSELKDMLIRKYKIERSRNLTKLYFSEKENSLLLHDYDDHRRTITLCSNLKSGTISDDLGLNAVLLVSESLKHPSPAEFLIREFQLNGFFRS